MTSTTFGKGVADNFQKKFEELGGKVVLRQGAGKDTTDFNSIISNAAVDREPPDGVYYGGVVTSGGGLFLKQLRQAGLTIPFIGPGRHRQRRGATQGLADPDRGRRRVEELVRHGRRDRRLPGQEGLRRGVHRALQGRLGLQDPGRVFAARRMPARPSSSSRSRQPSRPARPTTRPSGKASAPTRPTRPTSSRRSSVTSRSTRTATPPSRSSPSTSPIPPPRAASVTGSSRSSRTSPPSKSVVSNGRRTRVLRPFCIKVGFGQARRSHDEHGGQRDAQAKSPDASLRRSGVGPYRLHRWP